MFSKRFTCFHRCIGDSNILPAITSTFSAVLQVSLYFPLGICFISFESDPLRGQKPSLKSSAPSQPCSIWILAVLGLSACAHSPLIRPAPVPVVVVAPFESRVIISRLKYIHEVPKNLPRADEPTLIEQEIQHVEASLTDGFSQKLSSAGFAVTLSTAAPTLRIETTIEAYGRVPGKWLAFLLGSGAVEGTVQGIVLATAAGSAWAGVGIGLEEVVQETSTWGGGAFLTNRYLIPVILSCRIVRESDGKTLWSGHELSLYSHGIVKALPPAERGRREAQLAAVANHSLDELVRSIRKTWPKVVKKLR
jgi:hypothetical protein